jgi:uncharacterized membrane protein
MELVLVNFKNGRVLTESVIVGITMVILFFIIHMIMMRINESFSMSHLGIAIAVLLSSVLFHLLFEILGWNRYYVNYYKSA